MDNVLSYYDAASYHEHPSQRLDAMRRTIAEALNSSGHNNTFYTNDYNEGGPPNPKIEELVKTIFFALMQQSMEYLKEPDGEAVMVRFIGLLARATSRDRVKVAIQVSAHELTTGLWDGCRQKLDESAMKVPWVRLWMGLLVAGTYGVLVAMGLLLSLWRFSLYGLVQEINIWYAST